MDNVDSLRKLFLHISEHLEPDEVKTLKHLVKDKQITTRDIEKMGNSAEEIFIKLEESGCLSETKLGLLKELLRELRRKPLVEMVENFEARQRQSCKVDGDGHQHNKSTGSTASEHRTHSPDTQRPTEITASKCPDIVLECEKSLKSYYRKLSHILPSPWLDGTNRLKLENVYIELELQTKEGNKRDFARQEIFLPKNDGDSHTNPKRVLIEGDPGYGKSTFCSKLAYDWAEGNVEYLNCFKLLFWFELKDLLECDGKHVQNAIFNQLLWDVREEGKRQELWNYIQDNQINVCFVFDGLDEVPTENLPQYFKDIVKFKKTLLPDCPVIVTSRKIRDKNSKQMYDIQLLIKGFDSVKAKDFVEKHINEMNSTGELQKEANVSDFVKELEMSGHINVLLDFMQSPLNTLMLCDIWIYENRLPHTITKLYEEIIGNVVKRYKESHDCNSHFEEEIKQALFLMGEMSYLGLTSRERKVYFSEKDISKNRYVRELGFLTKISGIPSRYGFYHLTFQEYFASVYVVELLTTDRSKFVDAVYLLSIGNTLGYKDTVLAFMGGKLGKKVDEIFKIWEKERFSPKSIIDPRPILYESCCESTDAFKRCARFLPKELRIDFNKIFRESHNKLDVNATVLQCADIRSESISFILPVLKAGTVKMYQKCYEALQRNGKTFKNIDVVITCERNENNSEGNDCIDDFVSIIKPHCGSRPDLKPATVHYVSLKIEKSPFVCIERYITHIVKELSWVSTDNLSIENLPFGNLEFMQDVLVSLSGNKQLKAVYVRFCEDSPEIRENIELQITAKVGKFNIHYLMNTMNFRLMDLQTFLSALASLHNERVSLNVKIKSYVEKKSKCAKTFETIEFLRVIFRHLGTNRLLKAIDLSFYHDYKKSVRFYEYDDYTYEQYSYTRYVSTTKNKIYITAKAGKFTIDYRMNDMDFKLVDLHDLLSKFGSFGNQKVSLDVEIESEFNYRLGDNKTEDILHNLESVDIDQLYLNITEHPAEIKQVISLHASNIVKALSRVSARKLKINALPLGNIEFMRDVFTHLGANRILEAVDLSFYWNYRYLDLTGHYEHDMEYEMWKSCISKNMIHVTAKAGNFTTRYEMNDMDFKLADLHELLSTFGSFGNQKVSLDVEIKSDFKDKETGDITDILHALESVDIGQLSIIRTYDYNANTEDIYLRALNIVKAVSRVSVYTLNINGLPHGNIEFLRNMFSHLGSNRLLKAVNLVFYENYPSRVNEDLSSFKNDFDGLVSSFRRFGRANDTFVRAKAGEFLTFYQMNNLDISFVDLLDLLSTFGSFDNEKVSLDVAINSDFYDELECDIPAKLHNFESVDDVGQLSLIRGKYSDSNTENFVSHASSFIEALSRVSANRLTIKTLPLGNVEFMRDVFSHLGTNSLLKAVHMSFSDDYFYEEYAREFTIWAKVGKFTTHYEIDDMDFKLVDIHDLLSTFGSFENERVLLYVTVKSHFHDITDILHNLESVDIDQLEIINNHYFDNTEDICLRASSMVKALSRVSANMLNIDCLPPGNMKFMRDVFSCIGANRLLKAVDLSFKKKFLDQCKITAKVGKFTTCYETSSMDFKLVDLHDLLSTFGSFENERVLLDVRVGSDFNDELNHNITDILHNLESVHIDQLEIIIQRDRGENTEDTCLRALTIVKALSRVSTNTLNIERLPLGNIEFMRGVFSCLNANRLLKAVDLSFQKYYVEAEYLRYCEDYDSECGEGTTYDAQNVIYVTAKAGKFTTYYEMNNMDFKFEELHDLLSTFGSSDNESVSLDVKIKSDFKDKETGDVTDILHALESVDIGQLSIIRTDNYKGNTGDIYLDASTIVKAVSRVSANTLNINGLPHGNMKFMRDVFSHLGSNRLLKAADLSFYEDNSDHRVEDYTIDDIKNMIYVTAKVGKFTISYKIDNMDFRLVDLHDLLSTLTSVGNERVSLDVKIICYIMEKLAPNINDMLQKIDLVDIRQMSLNITRPYNLSKEEFTLFVSTIMKTLSRVPADKLEFDIERIPNLDLELVREVARCLHRCLILKPVHMEFCWNSPYSRQESNLKFRADFGKFRTDYLMNTTDFMDVEFVDLHRLLSPFASVDNERLTLAVEINCDIEKQIDSFITKLLLGLQPDDNRYVLLTQTGACGLYNADICMEAYTKVLSQASANKVYIKGLPFRNLHSIGSVLGCLNRNSLLQSVAMEFCESCLKAEETGNLEISVKFGKFKLSYKMNKINFSLLGLKESLLQYVPVDSCSIKMAMKVNYNLKQSKDIDLSDVCSQCVSVCIEKMTLQMLNGADVKTEDIYYCTSDVIQSLSMVDAKAFVIYGLPARNLEFIKAVHTDLVKSVPNKLTHIYFEPLCFQTCEIQPLEHSNLIAKSCKHSIEIGICKSQFDIDSFHQEFHKTLSRDEERFTLDALIKCNSNIKFDSQYISSCSRRIFFNRVNYVEEFHAIFPAIEVLEGLAAVNTQQFLYKSKESIGYNLSKSVLDVMLQFQSAQTVFLSSARQCNDIEIAENIKKYVNDGMIVRGVKFEGKLVTIQGMFANEANTLSKLIEVEFTLNHKSNVDFGYDDVSHALLDDNNSLAKIYKNICYSLHSISDLKSLCLRLSDVLSSKFSTCHQRVFLAENVHSCVLQLPSLTEVNIIGGKITSNNESSRTWIELFTKESLEKVDFKDCDLNDSCQSLIINSVIKADEHRRSLLKITLCDSLSSENVDLMKVKLFADKFFLSDTPGSASHGDIVFSLRGKYVSIVAMSCKETNEVN